MFIYSFVEHPVTRGLHNPKKRGRVEEVSFNFNPKVPKALAVPEFAEEWVSNLHKTYPEKYVIGNSEKGVLDEVKKILKEKEDEKARQKQLEKQAKAKKEGDNLDPSDLLAELEKKEAEKQELAEKVDSHAEEKKALVKENDALKEKDC